MGDDSSLVHGSSNMLQGGVHIHRGGVSWICVEYVYGLVMIRLEL